MPSNRIRSSYLREQPCLIWRRRRYEVKMKYRRAVLSSIAQRYLARVRHTKADIEK